MTVSFISRKFVFFFSTSPARECDSDGESRGCRLFVVLEFYSDLGFFKLQWNWVTLYLDVYFSFFWSVCDVRRLFFECMIAGRFMPCKAGRPTGGATQLSVLSSLLVQDICSLHYQYIFLALKKERKKKQKKKKTYGRGAQLVSKGKISLEYATT